MAKLKKETRSKDSIHKQALLQAPPARVWQAITDAREFGTWFGVRTDDEFEEGARIRGTIVPTSVDAEIAELQRPHEGLPFEMTIERIELQRLFEFSWHPFAVERDQDYGEEPTTLVSFELEPQGEGTRLTITESGFERLPKDRRAAALQSNAEGWEKQLQLIDKYLGGTVAAGKEDKAGAKSHEPSTRGEQALLKLEQKFWEALKERDVEAALALTDFPCIVAGPQGVGSIDKQEFAAMLKNAKYTINRAELSDVQVRLVSDDVAVVAYKVHEELLVEGKPIKLDAADSSTWVRRDGQWACAAHTEVLVGDPFGRDRLQV